MSRVVLLAAIVAIVLPGASVSTQSAQTSYSIDPLLIVLDADSKNAVMTITNTSSNEIRFELKAFAWDQAPPDGTMQLTPTSDIVIFPPLVTMKPHAIQRVRVGTTVAQGPIEKSYRIMLEELPSGEAPPNVATVSVRTRVGVPVFLQPVKPTLSGKIDTVRIDNRNISIDLTNTGTTHAMVDSVVVRGMSAPDQVVFEDSLQGWYVLAGKTRTWRYTIKPAQCRNLKSIDIEVYAHEHVLTKSADVTAGACPP